MSVPEPASVLARERVLIVGFLLILALGGVFVVWPELGGDEEAVRATSQEGLAKKPAM